MLFASMHNARRESSQATERTRQQQGGHGKTQKRQTSQEKRASFEQHRFSLQSPGGALKKKNQEAFEQHRFSLQSPGGALKKKNQEAFEKHRFSLQSPGRALKKKNQEAFDQYRRSLSLGSLDNTQFSDVDTGKAHYRRSLTTDASPPKKKESGFNLFRRFLHIEAPAVKGDVVKGPKNRHQGGVKEEVMEKPLSRELSQASTTVFDTQSTTAGDDDDDDDFSQENTSAGAFADEGPLDTTLHSPTLGMVLPLLP